MGRWFPLNCSGSRPCGLGVGIMNKIRLSLVRGLLGLMLYVPCYFGVIADESISFPASSTVQAFDEGVPAAARSNAALEPYGSSLFRGSYSGRKQSALDPDYQVEPGDRIALRIWGGTTVNETLSVDSNGNIFIPEVGEVRMVGVKSSAVSSVIKREVNKAYKDGVNVYASLLSATRRDVQIFVTGNVLRPGQYVGSPEDSVLAFLHQAGGVDPRRGSYRYVLVQRGKQRLAVVDLYNFINNGDLPKVLFRNGDTIVVRPQGNMINVYGEARNNFRFEFLGGALNGAQLVRYARPESSVTNVALSGTRKGLPYSSYLNYAQFLRTRLLDGDTVRFVSDASSPVIDISVEGSHLGNSYFAVQRGSRLQEVLDYISVNPDDADIGNVYIKRKRVAEEQKKNIDASLRRLERSVLTAPARSDGEAAIRAKEAELVLKFVERAGRVVPEGRIVVADRGKVANIRLEDGDVIVIPAKSDVVTISGEVQVPQAVVYARNASIHDYIAQAGGYTERANRKRLVVVKPNGKVVMGELLQVDAGDNITVYPEIDTKDVQATKDIVQIIYQIAVAASAVGL
uniref:Capsular polysaccharide export system periplasmic protein KpsD n=1 Tax=uncultured Thiotrichaceae bacterium TaxID=298394 RepID=A0A6S6UD14_9GAMM|nr:MAG: Capsular polysaccharide export system periplasmic protein KpsD [uncultured Thiotrichaceae bacterium]